MFCFFVWYFPVIKKLSALFLVCRIIKVSFRLWETRQLWEHNIRTVLKITGILSQTYKLLLSFQEDDIKSNLQVITFFPGGWSLGPDKVCFQTCCLNIFLICSALSSTAYEFLIIPRKLCWTSTNTLGF